MFTIRTSGGECVISLRNPASAHSKMEHLFPGEQPVYEDPALTREDLIVEALTLSLPPHMLTGQAINSSMRRRYPEDAKDRRFACVLCSPMRVVDTHRGRRMATCHPTTVSGEWHHGVRGSSEPLLLDRFVSNMGGYAAIVSSMRGYLLAVVSNMRGELSTTCEDIFFLRLLVAKGNVQWQIQAEGERARGGASQRASPHRMAVPMCKARGCIDMQKEGRLRTW